MTCHVHHNHAHACMLSLTPCLRQPLVPPWAPLLTLGNVSTSCFFLSTVVLLCSAAGTTHTPALAPGRAEDAPLLPGPPYNRWRRVPCAVLTATAQGTVVRTCGTHCAGRSQLCELRDCVIQGMIVIMTALVSHMAGLVAVGCVVHVHEGHGGCEVCQP